MKKKLSIFIATHKKNDFPKMKDYIPIHVGKKQCNFSFCAVSDDIGDSISEKNYSYCELTAQYWIWKNISNVEYVGLCHYRRFFSKNITSSSIDVIIGNYDIILPRKMYWMYPLMNKLITELSLEDAYIFYTVILKMYPDYKNTVDYYLFNNNVDYGFNMFICKKECFDQFADWQFSILSECEKYLKPSGYSRMRRVYGYLGEFLLPIWVIHNKLRIKTVPLLDGLNGNPIFSKHYYLKKYLYTLIFKMTKLMWKTRLDVINDNSIITGLKQDGII